MLINGTYKVRKSPYLDYVLILLGLLISAVGYAGFSVAIGYYLKILRNPFMLAFLFALPNLIGSLLRLPSSAQVGISGGGFWYALQMLMSIVGTLIIFVITITHLGHYNMIAFYVIAIVAAIFLSFAVAMLGVAIARINFWFPTRKIGSYAAIVSAVGLGAPNLFVYIMNLIRNAAGVPYMYLSWAAIMIAIFIIYIILARDPPFFSLMKKYHLDEKQVIKLAKENNFEASPSKKHYIQGILTACRFRTTWLLSYIIFAPLLLNVLVMSWFVQYLEQFYKIAPSSAALWSLILIIISVIVRIVGGFIMDIVHVKTVIVVTLFVSAAATLFIPIFNNFAISTVMFGIGLAAGSVTSSAGMKGAVYYLKPHASSVLGMVLGIGGVAGFFGPIFMSLFLGHNYNQQGFDMGYQYGYYLIFAFVFIALILSFFLKETRFSKQEHEKHLKYLAEKKLHKVQKDLI